MPTCPLPLARPAVWLSDRDRQQQPRRSDSVARRDNRARRLVSSDAAAVEIRCASNTAVGPGRNLVDPAPRAQLDAQLHGEGPVGDVCPGLCFADAPEVERTAVVTCLSPLPVGRRVHVTVRRPPMPAQPVECLSHVFSVQTQRQRRHWPWLSRRVGRVSGDTATANYLIVQVVVMLQLVVSQRPVVRRAVERLHTKVRRVHPRSVGGPDDRAATDRVEHERGDIRIFTVDGIVFVQRPLVRIEVPVGPALQFPVDAGGRRDLGTVPATLLEAHHPESRAGQPPGRSRARRSGAND